MAFASAAKGCQEIPGRVDGNVVTASETAATSGRIRAGNTWSSFARARNAASPIWSLPSMAAILRQAVRAMASSSSSTSGGRARPPDMRYPPSRPCTLSTW